MNKRQHWAYEELMECYVNDEEFNVSDCKEGMLFFAHRKSSLGWAYLVNTESKECFELMSIDGSLSAFSLADIDFDSVSEFEHTDEAYKLSAHHGIIMHDFEDGVACLTWRIYCDYRYGYIYETEYGDCIHAYIDKHCNVLIPFRSMTDKQKVTLRKRAVEILEDRLAQ